jgi:hypothetical protein
MADETSPLSDEERSELEQLRAEKQQAEQRAELERLRAEHRRDQDDVEEARQIAERREHARESLEPDDDLHMPVAQKVILVAVIVMLACGIYYIVTMH